MREVKVGDAIVFVDEHAVCRPALVTTVWPSMGGLNVPGVNLVLVNPDASYGDTYGRQISRRTSVTHATAQPAHGMYWRHVDEAGKGTEVAA